MDPAHQVLAVNNDLPIRTDKSVHNGKVRSVYWLTASDSKRLIIEKNYDVAHDTPLAIMVISDRISAFDCVWHADAGMHGVPGKGVALNAISSHWFKLFKEQGLADSHILDIPHPYVWIVKKARPVMIEAIARQYITGSMWRSYEKGSRYFCGIKISNSLKNNQKLPELLITPSTKGILEGIPNVPAVDDVNITRKNIEDNFSAFNFSSIDDINRYEHLLKKGFNVISDALSDIGEIFVDTKFEFGYVKDKNGIDKLIYIDEVGTPDSSRIWDAKKFAQGEIVENSKEDFRQLLLNYFPDPDILLNNDRMTDRIALARDHTLPTNIFMEISKIYLAIAEKIIGKKTPVCEDPKVEIIDVLRNQYQLID